MTRNVILHLVDKQVLFKGYSSKALNAHYGLDTASQSIPMPVQAASTNTWISKVMSALEASSIPSTKEHEDPLRGIRKVITEDLGIDPSFVTDADCVAVARVSEIVGTRGCRLNAVAIAAVVRQTGHDKSGKSVRFGLDGSLVEFYPRFEQRVRAALVELVGKDVEQRIKIGLAKDGSGIGAALCAQAAKKQLDAGLAV